MNALRRGWVHPLRPDGRPPTNGRAKQPGPSARARPYASVGCLSIEATWVSDRSSSRTDGSDVLLRSRRRHSSGSAVHRAHQRNRAGNTSTSDGPKYSPSPRSVSIILRNRLRGSHPWRICTIVQHRSRALDDQLPRPDIHLVSRTQRRRSEPGCCVRTAVSHATTHQSRLVML